MKLKVHDRVAVYDATEVGLHRTVGTIRLINDDGIHFIADYPADQYVWYVHPKQCRKIKKKRIKK